MAKRNLSLQHHPSDHYIKEALKVEAVGRQFVQTFLPPEELALLNLNTLQLAPDSFIGEDLRHYFSDIVYTCQTQQGKPMRVCLLIEHKSTPVGRRIYVQLGNYLRSIQEEDIRQQREYFTLTIPMLILQSDEGDLVLLALEKYYGEVPEVMQGYIPGFKVVVVRVQALTDEFLEGLRHSLLLRNVLLVLKYARDADYMRVHFREVLTFVSDEVSTE
ncbi:MAG: Rpn family recombination-promoting nuclease/putative transposase, partial [Saprospiraceae bacterium]|nr:Rpn family recombination-promoting nuclease/putative transposase [Saprospiraceae bacterium]